MATTAVTPQPNQQSNVNVMAANEQARRLLTRRAVEMTQEIYSNTVDATKTQILNIVPRNVGIIKRFVIKVEGTITNSGTTTVDITETGLSNLVSNITFYDLQNNLRINTTGAHLYHLSSMKRRTLWGIARPVDQGVFNNGALPYPGLQGLNNPVFMGPVSLAGGETANVRTFIEVPLAYSDDDLRGAVFANVVNTTMSLQVTLNSSIAMAEPQQDFLGYAYWGPAGTQVSFASATVVVYQIYLDQLPSAANGQLILPNIDLATVYQITNTTLTGVTPNQDYPIPYANFRDFFSVLLYYFNGNFTVYDSGDINYFSLTTANFTNIFKYDPYYAGLKAREVLDFDLPSGWYYFSSRRHPIWTTQFGNQQLNLNANIAVPGAYVFVMWEAMALQNTLIGSASLPAGG